MKGKKLHFLYWIVFENLKNNNAFCIVNKEREKLDSYLGMRRKKYISNRENEEEDKEFPS